MTQSQIASRMKVNQLGEELIMEATEVKFPLPSKDNWFVVLVTEDYYAEAGRLLFLHKPVPHSHFVLIVDTDEENQPDTYSSFIATNCLKAAGLTVAKRMWLSDPDLFAKLAQNKKPELLSASAGLLWNVMEKALAPRLAKKA